MATIWVQSMISHRTQEPMVSLYWPKNMEAAQLSPDEARQFALSVLQAAEAADQDAFLFHWAIDNVGADEAGAAGLINEYRKARGQDQGPDAPDEPDG